MIRPVPANRGSAVLTTYRVFFVSPGHYHGTKHTWHTGTQVHAVEELRRTGQLCHGALAFVHSTCARQQHPSGSVMVCMIKIASC